MSGPTVSACVISYNQRNYLTQCIEGIRSQRGDFAMEVVIADDCSTDGTLELAQSFAERDPRIRVIQREQNLGMGANLRGALEACTGEFIALCEADDFWTDPEKLARQLPVFADARVTICGSGGFVTDDSGRQFVRSARYPRPRYLSAADILAVGGGQWPTCSTVLRRKCLQAVPKEIYDQPVIDWPLNVFVAAQGRAWYDPAPTCAWRIGARGSWTEDLKRAERFVRHHQRHRGLEALFRRELGPAFDHAIQRGFAKHILYFYAADRVPARDKWNELPTDLPRLGWGQRIAAVFLASLPGVGELLLSLRRKLLRRDGPQDRGIALGD